MAAAYKWDDPRYFALSDLGRGLFDFLCEGPLTVGTVPGLVKGGPLAFAEALGRDGELVRAALLEIVSVGLAQWDEPVRLVRIPNRPKYDRPKNGFVVASWYGRWKKLPESKLKRDHIASLAPFCEKFATDWAETFGSEMLTAGGVNTPVDTKVHTGVDIGACIYGIGKDTSPPALSGSGSDARGRIVPATPSAGLEVVPRLDPLDPYGPNPHAPTGAIEAQNRECIAALTDLAVAGAAAPAPYNAGDVGIVVNHFVRRFAETNTRLPVVVAGGSKQAGELAKAREALFVLCRGSVPDCIAAIDTMVDRATDLGIQNPSFAALCGFWPLSVPASRGNQRGSPSRSGVSGGDIRALREMAERKGD